MTPWQQLAVAALVFLGGGGGLFAFIRSLMDRPKIRAEAVEVITNAASTQIKNLEHGQESLYAELAALKTRLDATERKAVDAEKQVYKLTWYQRRVGRWWINHMPWDKGMQEIAREADPEAVRALPPLEPFPLWEEVGLDG